MRHIFVILLITICASTSAQKINISDAKLKSIDSIVQSKYKSDEPGISYQIVQGNKVLANKSYGMAELELGVTLNNDNVFAIGSISKQFTAIAMLKLVEQGKVNLKDDIKKYIPNYNTHSKVTTIENLLAHTSGILSFTEMQEFFELNGIDKNPEEIRNTFEDSALLFNPGSNWSYSNSGFFLTGYIIEKVSGMSYEDFLKKEIFEPAGMSNTTFGSNSELIKNRAHGYDPGENDNYFKAAHHSWNWPRGAGNIMSTTSDMVKWNNALRDGKIIKKELLKLAHTSQKLNDGRLTNYGLGWGVNKIANKTIITHGGAISGYLADAARIEEDDVYIVMLTNTTAKSVSDVLSKSISILLDIPTGDPKETKIAQDFESLPGVYEVNYVGGRVTSNSGKEKIYRTVTYENNTLYIQRTGGSKIELRPYQRDAFYIKGGSQRFVFKRDKNNKVIALDVSSYPLQFGPNDYGLRTNLEIPKAAVEIKVANEVLKKYIGTYELVPGFNIDISVDGNQIFAQATGQGKFEIFAKSNTSFFAKIVDLQIDFNADENGNIKSLTLTQGRKTEAKKIK